jgi:hypothetical protein
MEDLKNIQFDAVVSIEDRISKTNNIYQVMVIGIENPLTGEILKVHEVYIKENLRQVIEFILTLINDKGI